jgi:hypothetical protein
MKIYGDNPMELLKGKKLDKVMDKLVPLCLANIHNFVASFKHLDNRATLSILLLKSRRHYDYI